MLNKLLSFPNGYLKDKLSEQCIDQLNPSFGQYNLLAHLSTYFNNDVIADIGTGYQALTARSLSYNKTNTIHSYDTEYIETANNNSPLD